jgi:23S rRNA (uracil1939-C5)-methyltransferase
VQLKIEKLIYGGDALAHLPADATGRGKSVFVPFALEGEEVEATPIEQKPGFARARLEKVIQASAERVQPGCPYFFECGGCQYQHASYEHQLQAKSAILVETLRRTAKIDLGCELQVHSSPEWRYRNRTRLKVHNAPEFALGYYKFRSHQLQPIEECPISSPLINQAIRQLWAAGRNGRIAACVREIEIFADHADGRLLLELYCDRNTSRADATKAAEGLLECVKDVVGVVCFTERRANDISEPQLLASAGSREMQYETQEANYRVSAGAFFQANRFLIEELVNAAISHASGKLALDLYAGVGLFATVLARSFAQVIAVEASQTSYRDLRHNAPQEVKAVLATTEQYLGQVSGIRPELVVVDPPRGGLGENVVRGLAKLDAARLTYVSCDPSTLARDLRQLSDVGYRIEEAHLIDLFPQTFHIESVFHLARSLTAAHD